MKTISILRLSLTGLLLAAFVSGAAVPRLINYQGYLTDTGGLPVDGSHNLTFNIYADSSAGVQALWTEVHASVSVGQGLFSVILGGTTTIPDSLFAGPMRWIGITVDTDSEMKPLMRLTSVPYALRAAVADSAIAVAGGGSGGGGDITGVYAMDGLWSPDSGDAGDVHLFVQVVPGSGLMLDPVDGVMIEPEGVTGDKIASGAVTTAKLDSASVTGTKLASQAVSSAALATAAVTNDKLASFAVADTNLRVNAVTADKIAGGAVSRDKLFDLSVNTAKLDTNAVTSGKIQNASILFEDIAANGASEGQVMKYVGGAWAARNDSVGDGVAIDGVWGGTGLTGGGTSGTVTLAVDFGGSGADTTVARSDHDHDAAYVNEGQDSSVTAAMIVDGTILLGDIGQNGAGDNQVIKWSAAQSAWVVANDSVGSVGSGSGGWADDGNYVRLETAGDSVGIGTSTPAEKLDIEGNIRASGKAAFGSGHNNSGASTFVAGRFNVARGDYSVVSGGGGPAPSDSNATLGGYCVVGGGSRNLAGYMDGGPDTTRYATVGGGVFNRALGEGTTIGGGSGNMAGMWGPPDEGKYATVGGGRNNRAASHYSFIGGGSHNAAGDTMSSPDQSQYAIVTGGYLNVANGSYATIGGGAENTIGTSGGVPGEEGDYATVGGGRYNQALGNYSVVCGGGSSGGPYSNRAFSDYSVVGGGEHNFAGGTGPGPDTHATTCGGLDNMANSGFSAIGGGTQNSVTGWAGVVGGGSHNTASGDSSVVAGGADNTASASYATVGGGTGNRAGGEHATVPGGWFNEAMARNSFAAGTNAKARHQGSVVISAWQDGNPADSVATGKVEQMVLRAGGGFYLTDQSEVAPGGGSKFIETSTGAWLSDTGQWENASDRALKENFTDIDGEELLERLAELPITRWNFKTDDDGITHIGPVAQEFHAAFRVGYSDKTISSVNLGGVSLAAVKELAQQNQQQKAQIEELRGEVEELKTLVRRLLEEGRSSGD